MSLTVDEVQARLLMPRFRRRQLGGMLLDQAFLAGLGNYLRAEILWQAELAPQHKPQDLAPDALRHLAEALLAVPRLSYQTRGQADDNRHHGALFRFKVFHRSGEPCERCGGMIVRTELSSRPFIGAQAARNSQKTPPERAALCVSAGKTAYLFSAGI